jgi:hypothetical protein
MFVSDVKLYKQKKIFRNLSSHVEKHVNKYCNELTENVFQKFTKKTKQVTKIQQLVKQIKMKASPIPFPPEVDCFYLQLIGISVALLVLSSFIFNGLLLLIFICHKNLQTPINMLVIVVAILNLIATCFSLPFVVISNLNCQ